jgi:hypothetical protein
MKSLVTLTGATVALIAGSAMAFADLDVIDHSGQTSAPSIRDQAALNACADAFLARIAPGSTPKAHILVPPGERTILSPSRPNITLEVTMEARSTSHALLARSTCEVDYQAKVTHMFTSVVEPAVLARLALKDIQLGLVSRL